MARGAERWLSWSKALAWRASRQKTSASWVRIPPSPPFFRRLRRLWCEDLKFGRARRGVSGALYPQSAVAELNSCPRHVLFEACPVRAVLMAGSCATGLCEPRQGRKAAAVSKSPRVPRGSLVGAGCIGNVWRGLSTAGARPFFEGWSFEAILLRCGGQTGTAGE